MHSNYFICQNCGNKVSLDGHIGVKNRNHCPKCLYSLHVDVEAGDRAEKCQGKMKPIALTFKLTDVDKYGNPTVGELMLVHQCEKCGEYSINRIAGDDDANKILEVFEESVKNTELFPELLNNNIIMAREDDLDKVKNQLFGKI